MITEKKYGPISNAFNNGFDEGFSAGFKFGVALMCFIAAAFYYLFN